MEHLFHHAITVYGAITRDEFNEETFASPVIYTGRFHLIDKVVIDIKGESVKADAVVYLPQTATNLTIGTKITYNNQDYRVISLVESLDAGSVIHHYEVYVQRWS